MKKLTWVIGAGWVLGAVQACGSTEQNGSEQRPVFSSSVPGDKTLESLSENEADAVCRDLEEFMSRDTIRQDNCHMFGVLSAAFTAEFSPEASDAELRTLCSDTYEQCANAADSSDGECTSNEFSENCAASVDEYGACLEESFGALHGFVRQLPRCSALSRQTLSEMSPEGTPFGTGIECEVFRGKCPGISQAAEDFVDDYCARINPCCSDPNLGDECRTLTIQRAQALDFDSDAAQDCLARLEQLEAEPDFCSGVAQGSYYSAWSAAVPECEAVFSGGEDSGASGPVGSGSPVGAACDWDEDCAASESGRVRCVPTTSIFDKICTPVTRGEAGDTCLGTVADVDGGTVTEWASNAPSDGGALCDHADNLRCDEETHTCVGAGQLGDACSTMLDCASDAYCAPSGVCSTRLAAGAHCDNYSGECAGAGVCDDISSTCTLPLPVGAACSDSGGTPCASGSCVEGVCTHPLAPLCGER